MFKYLVKVYLFIKNFNSMYGYITRKYPVVENMVTGRRTLCFGEESIRDDSSMSEYIKGTYCCGKVHTSYPCNVRLCIGKPYQKYFPIGCVLVISEGYFKVEHIDQNHNTICYLYCSGASNFDWIKLYK